MVLIILTPFTPTGSITPKDFDAKVDFTVGNADWEILMAMADRSYRI
jgi:hypothetical protein